MGLKHTKAAWQVANLSPSTKLVLLALADFANDKADTCWPSLDTLSAMTGRDRRTVMRSLDELEQHGAITRDRTSGRKSTRYTLRLDDLTPPPQQGHHAPVGEDVNRGTMPPSTGASCHPQQGRPCAQQGRDAPRTIRTTIYEPPSSIGDVTQEQAPDEPAESVKEQQVLHGYYTRKATADPKIKNKAAYVKTCVRDASEFERRAVRRLMQRNPGLNADALAGRFYANRGSDLAPGDTGWTYDEQEDRFNPERWAQ